MSNVLMPAPGSKGIAVVKDLPDGQVAVVQVHVYGPDGKGHITVNGDGLPPFANEDAARQAVSKELANCPVGTINIKNVV